MLGVLAGFAVIWIIILVGALVGRRGLLGEDGQRSLSAFAFWVASPCLLFLTVSRADAGQILSAPLLVALVSAWSTALLWWAWALLLAPGRPRRRTREQWGEVIMSGQAASMVNSANLGIPLTTFVLGDAAAVVPVILFQLAVYTPLHLLAMDLVVLGHRPSALSLPRSVLGNPMVLGSLLGLTVSVTGVDLPQLLIQPVELIAGAAIPCMLAAFGMSLVAHRPLEGSPSHRRTVLGLSVLKLAVQPLIAWAVGIALGLEPTVLYGAVLMAALPTAQNIYVAAVRYRSAEPVSRDVVLVTSIADLGTMAAVALLLT